MTTVEEAVRRLRADPRYAARIRDSYLDKDVRQAAEQYRASAEFSEIRSLLEPGLQGAVILDVGAGNGIASWALATSGAALVYAVEPDPSDEIGLGAIAALAGEVARIVPVPAAAESLPLPDAAVDIVFARQVLHHTADLSAAVRECARVLKPGGRFLTCREHVVDDEQQLAEFLSHHPVHRLAGGEGARPLDEYLAALHGAGLVLVRVWGPWDTIINAFPSVRSTEELERLPRSMLARRLGRFAALASLVPGVEALVWWRIKRPHVPGRLFSFFALKPG